MDKRKLKKMGIHNLALLDEISAARRLHPEWGARKMQSYLKTRKDIFISLEDINSILEQENSVASSVPGMVLKVKKAAKSKVPSSYWGWFAW